MDVSTSWQERVVMEIHDCVLLSFFTIELSIVKRFYNTFRAAVRHIEERSCVRFYRHVNAAAQGNTYAVIRLQPNR